MAVAILSLLGLFVSGYLALYNLGYLGDILCTVGGCETVQTSEYANFLGMPVALWGVGAYLSLLVVSLAGIQPGLAGKRWVALAIFGLAAIGVAFSAYLTFLEAFVIEAWCQWCVISAVLIALIFLFSIPGLRDAR